MTISTSVRIHITPRVVLSATLLTPTSEPRGGVVLVHGFAADRNENGLFSKTAKVLAEGGYSVLAYDWRGLGSSSGNFGKTPLSVHVSDFVSVVRWFERRSGIPRKNIAAVGFSLGATLILSAIRRKKLKLAGVVLWSPALRPKISMWPRYDSPEMRSELRRKGIIVKPENGIKLGRPLLESLKRFDLGPNALLAVGIPVSVHHGTADSRIPILATQEIALRAKGNGVAFTAVQGASHSFRPEEKYWPKLTADLSDWLQSCAFKPAAAQIGQSSHHHRSAPKSRVPVRRVSVGSR